MSPRLKPWLIPAGLALLVLCLYHHTLHYPFVRWDDGLLVYENPKVWGFSWQNLKAIFSTYDPELYIPLTLLTYQLDFTIAGHKATFYHFQNLLWHGLAAGAVYFFILKLTGKQLVAALTGLLFALHPINTEAAIWISARKDLVSTTFFFFGLASWLEHDTTGEKRWYRWSLVCLVLALLAKTTYIIFPAVIVLLDWLQRYPLNRKRIKQLIAPSLICFVFLLIALYGKRGVPAATDPMAAIWLISYTFVFYLQNIVWPTGLTILYPFFGEIGPSHPKVLLGFLILPAIFLVALSQVRKTRWPLFGLSWLVLCTFPTTMNLKQGSLINLFFASDRYIYSGAVGMYALVALGMVWLYQHRPEWRNAVLGATGAVMLVLLVLAFRQSLTWKNSLSLFGKVVQEYPAVIIAHNNLANYHREQRDLEQAIESYETSLSFVAEHPDTEDNREGHSKILSNYASAIRQAGDIVQSETLYQEAIELNEANYIAHLGMGIIHATKADYEQAAREYDLAIALKPNSPSAHVNRGALHVKLGEIDQAIAMYQKAIEVNPFFPQSYYNLGIALQKSNKPRQAREQYEHVLTLAPRFTAARINLGILYAEREWPDKAIEQFKAVLQYDPQNKRALSALRQLGAS